ncbi:membrane-bound lytic murein transglycosylase A [Rhodobiaceae bacterium]|nr:membrane-bound lytic murein transglycosylase A [Rhodobiaceae bacterium]
MTLNGPPSPVRSVSPVSAYTGPAAPKSTKSTVGPTAKYIFSTLIFGLFLGLTACTEPDAPGDDQVSDPTGPTLSATRFEALPGWASDDHGAALEAFRRSCERILAANPTRVLDAKTGDAINYGATGDWQPVCREALSAGAATDPRGFFEKGFQAFAVTAENGPNGLMTGYYEPEIEASLVREGPYQTPLMAKPSDLQRLDLGEFDPTLKGETIRGRLDGGRFVPYPDRAAINDGALDPGELAVAWVKDPVDAFFTHIQGSARLKLPDGSVARVGFAEKNGRPYTAIGKVLIERGALSRETVSMASIRDWLAANPNEMQSVLEANRSYVFFTRRNVSDPGLGPVGAGGVALSPGRSLAVDRRTHALGAPIWFEAVLPGDGDPTQKLMVAQDTGSAIRGAVRGDYFWGSGAAAGAKAGEMKADGRFWVLLPSTLATRQPALADKQR